MIGWIRGPRRSQRAKTWILGYGKHLDRAPVKRKAESVALPSACAWLEHKLMAIILGGVSDDCTCVCVHLRLSGRETE